MRILRKSLSILLVMTMVISLFTVIPFEVSAASAITINDHHWDSENQQVVSVAETVTDYTLLSSGATDLDSGLYAVMSDTTASNRLHVANGKTVGIYLDRNVTLTCNNGICVDKGGTLHIYAAESKGGNLSINMNNGSRGTGDAAIGANSGNDSGKICIHGGTITVVPKHGNYGAGIGGGYHRSADVVEIWDGDVTCKADDGYYSRGAGIGGGSNASVSWNSEGGVFIYGGKVDVRSRTGAGIGNGYYTLERSRTGSINIFGGEVTAQTKLGAGIGGGCWNSNCPINISGGKVTAVSTATPDDDGGAGIGSGASADQGDAINISGGTVLATAVEGAGVGSGDEGKSKEINITGGTVVATSVRGGAGIGSGCEGNAAGAIMIQNANIVATSKNYELGDSWDNAIKDQIGRTNWYSDGEKYYATGLLIVSALLDWFSCEESGAAIGGGEDGKFTSISIINSEVSATSGNYAAAIGSGDEAGDGGTIYISGSTVTATSGTDAAAIGGGNECSVNTITIEDCPSVTATSSGYAAGIGGGDDGGFGTINISNSTVTSTAGDFGAGIGTGEWSPHAGTINISNHSNVKAYAGTDGAGIGTGNEAKQTADINITDSTVEAHSGDYAAGIGGGDDNSGGTIMIRRSTVKAWGGKDGAGIGGGEDGNGGHIEIHDSNVYAEGFHYGAGIGGGEDAGASFVGIYGESTVEADAGGSGYGVAIGNGDYDAVFHSKPSSNITIDNTLRVKAGKKGDASDYPVYLNSSAVSSNKYAYIYPCPHSNKRWLSINEASHEQRCLDCGKRIVYDDHHWDSDYVCTDCGAAATMIDVTVIEQSNSGETRRSFRIPKYSYAVLPECENVPDGKEFVCWKTSITEDDYMQGEQIQYTDSCTLTAFYLSVADTEYINEYGGLSTVRARRLTQSDLNTNVFLPSGWYVVDENITSDKAIDIKDYVNLILADGKTLKLTANYAGAITTRDVSMVKPNHLSLYGQSAGTGTLNCTGSGLRLPYYEQYGGIVKNAYDSFHVNTVIAGGKYNSENTYQSRNGIINGGCVDAGYWNVVDNLTLGWTGLTDTIRFGEFEAPGVADGTVSVSIEDGKALTDGVTVYQGTLSTSAIENLSGKTLTPYLLHHYGEPRWEWYNDYRSAVAVFRCTDDDCSDELVADAKVSVVDENNIRTSTATCKLIEQIYTTTHTTKIVWDITIEENPHGTIVASKSSSKACDMVDLTITPDEGYVLKEWSVISDDEAQYVETEFTRFFMPASDVTVSAEFIPIVRAKEPWIDDSGAYHLGNIEHCVVDDATYEVNADGTIGERLDSVEVSYFEFKSLPNATYQINKYTGPKGIAELVIPKTYRGTKVERLGDNDHPIISYAEGEDKTPFAVVLSGNVTHINQYAFKGLPVTAVKGDTSGLYYIEYHAFANVNEADGYKIDLDLADSPQNYMSISGAAFENDDLTVRLKHSLTFDAYGAGSIAYDFTDQHVGGLSWNWAHDYSAATLTVNCSDERCGYHDTVDADVTIGASYAEASAVIDGIEYTDRKELPGQLVPRVEPYIDADGAYILGSLEHFVDADGYNRAVNADGTMGERLSSLDLSYFEFKALPNSTYQINQFTGPKDTGELVIPKTYRGSKVERIGSGDNAIIRYTEGEEKTPFAVALDGNITTINQNAFKELPVTEVKGDVSRLSTINYNAFANANEAGGYTLDLDLSGSPRSSLHIAESTFTNVNLTVHLKHTLTFGDYGASSVAYVFTDAHTCDEPVWEWSEDNTAAAATFICTDARCNHQETLNATVTREMRDGKNVRAATVSFNGETYTDVKDASYFGRHSITLNGDIGVNFYLNLTPAEKSTAVVDFSYTVNGKEWTSSVELKDAEKTEYGYKATCYVCAPEMTDDITAVLSIDGEEVETDHYSVKTYADVILSDAYRTEFLKTKSAEDYDRLAALVSTMLNYGAATQVQFADEHPNTVYANDGVDYDLVSLSIEELSAINMPKPDKDAINAQLTGTGLTYYGYTMLLHSKTSLRFYFQKDSKDTDISGVHLTVGDVTYNAQNYNDYFAYVEVESIPAYELSNAYTLSVNGTDLGAYSALTYVKDVLENSPEDTTLCNTVTAMYHYHKAALDYFNNN